MTEFDAARAVTRWHVRNAGRSDSREGVDVSTLSSLGAGALLVGCFVCAPAAQADPLIPPDNAEIQYLEQARRLLPIADDPVAFNSDGELLDSGRLACYRRDVTGQVGAQVTFVSPILTQLAFIYLCPQ